MKKDWLDIRFVLRLSASAVGFFVCAGLFLHGAAVFLKRNDDEEMRTLQQAVSRACVQCYAIEGRYPPSVEYLEEEYGIQIDQEKYAVFYSGFASNVMPEITVVPLEGD